VAVYEGLHFVYQLLYMYNYTQFFTPFLHLQGLTVTRQTINDMMRYSRKVDLEVSQRRSRQSRFGRLILAWYFLQDSVNAFLDASKYILPLTLFFFKFLEWWYHEPRFEAPPSVIPPAPDPPKRASGGLEIPSDHTLCAICREKRTNPAIATSGFVFCYPCLSRYVDVHHRCPVTFIPMNSDQIRKIYEDQLQ
jgi:hypothetical protein